MHWEKLLDVDLPSKAYHCRYADGLRKGVLELVKTCLLSMDAPKSTSYILSTLAHASHTDIQSITLEKESPRKEETKVNNEETQTTSQPPTNPNPEPQGTETNITSSMEKKPTESNNKFGRS